MSALPSPAHTSSAAPAHPAAGSLVARRPLGARVPHGVAAAGRTVALCALVLLVPGEAERVLADLTPPTAAPPPGD